MTLKLRLRYLHNAIQPQSLYFSTGQLCMVKKQRSIVRTINKCPQVFHILHLFKGRPRIADFLENLLSKTSDDIRLFSQHIHRKCQS
jgi:hypothetical protein